MTTDIDLKSLVRTIPDYPKPGIMFRDVTTLFGHPSGFRASVEQLVAPFHDQRVESVAGIEARGFILGGAAADRLHCGFVPIRKKGKLPAKAVGQEYELEYGVDVIEVHEDALSPGEPVLLVDDLIATGGTAIAAVELCVSSRPRWSGRRSSSTCRISAAARGSPSSGCSATRSCRSKATENGG